MIIRVGADHSVRLDDAYDFRAFSVVGAPTAELGRIIDGHVYVSQETVTRLAGAAADDPAWRRDFQAMVGYADEHGWVDASGAIRAHIDDQS